MPSTPFRRAAATLVGTAVLAALLAPAVAADETTDAALASLPQVETGERPGPDVLYAPPPALPQLENRHGWFRAPYHQVSGSERYVRGEYQYTDHLYDDHGADTNLRGGSSLSESAGDFTYPADPAVYGGNAADLVELRIARRGNGMRVRLSLNTLLDADVPMIVLAFDADDDDATGSATLPRDPGAPFPGTDHVLTVAGRIGEWSSWIDGAWVTTPVATTVDVEANQITSRVPASVAAPTGTWQATVAVGINDPDAPGTWYRPDPEAPGIYNLGFRFDEAYLTENTGPDTDQAAALTAGEPTRFEHPIDWDLLEADAIDDRTPTSGTMVRWYPSRLDLGEGRGTGFPSRIGRLVPYSIYVPSTYDGSPVPFTLNLHSLGQFHWQYNGSTGIQQLGEQRGSIVATPDGRGDDGWYQNEAEVDTFEVWNDVARHFALDPDRTAITGYSMGGYGTYRLGGLYPDLFGRAMTIVGPPGDGIWVPGTSSVPPETLSNAWLENTRNLPFLNLAAAEDELVPVVGPTQQNIGPATGGLQSFDALGYRFRYQLFPAAEHFTIALLRYDVPQAVDFFGDALVDRDPRHVTFAYAPDTDDAELGLEHDKAYWISDIVLADDTVGEPIPKGVVDAKSLASGLDDPPSTAGGDSGTTPLPYTEVNRTWGDPVEIAPENCVVLALDNVASFRLDAVRAGLDVFADICLRVTSTSPAIVSVVGPEGDARDVTVVAGRDEYVLAAAPTPVVPEGSPALLLLGGLAALVLVGGRRRIRS